MLCSQISGLQVLLKKILIFLSPELCMHSISWGLNFYMPEKWFTTHFSSKDYKTTLVDLFTLNNFVAIHFFLETFLLGDIWPQKNFGQYPTVEKTGLNWSVTIPVFSVPWSSKKKLADDRCRCRCRRRRRRRRRWRRQCRCRRR